MDVWLIHNGVRTGPYPDYEIRSKINSGELDEDSPAWHEGLPEWVVLSEIEIFKGEFNKQQEAPSAETPADFNPPPPPLPETSAPPKLWRRFWARWVDINIYVALWWLFLWGTGRNIEAIFGNGWIILTHLIPWVIIEIFLIHRFATTPGKWLLGIRVLNADGSLLSLTESTRRAVRAYVMGIGLNWVMAVTLICMTISVFTTLRFGKPTWDFLGNHRVVSKPLNPWGIILAVVLFSSAVLTQMAVTMPYLIKTLPPQKEEAKQLLEGLQRWTLPSRHK